LFGDFHFLDRDSERSFYSIDPSSLELPQDDGRGRNFSTRVYPEFIEGLEK